MFKFKQNIGLRLKIGFGVVLISFCLLSVFAVYKMNELADISHQIYNHPLTVSNAVRDIRAEILSMHRSMKDVVLAKDQQQLNQAINAVANSEDEVYKSFDTIFERYLGDSRNVQDAYNAFKEWTNIKQEVIELVKQGSSDQAAEITTSKGAQHVDYLDEKMKILSDFASNKADEFYKASLESSQNYIITFLIVMILTLGTAIMCSTAVTRSITNPIDYIISQMKIVSAGNLDHKINLSTNDEIGHLAQEFDSMTASLKRTTASRDELNAMNQQLKANEQQLRAANQQLLASEQQLLASEQQLSAANQQLQANEQQLRASNQQLKASIKEIEFANQAKTQFLANMSHEIRTPMNIIIGFMDLFEDEKLTDNQKLYLSQMNSASHSLLNLIDDILDISRIEAGKMSIRLAECSLGSLLQGIKNMMRIPADAKGLVFDIVRESALPATIRSDYDRIHQCLINLIGNAIKFTDAGHVHLKLSTTNIKSRTYICFDVEDTGIGIPPEKSESIFNIFTQADNSHTRKYGGTGLGLAITQQIVNLLGGTITFSSKPGKGSVFSMMIPAGVDMSEALLLDDDYLTSQPEAEPQHEPKENCNFSGNVLLAEDNEGTRILTSRMLESLGLTVTSVKDGNQVLNALQADSFDAILMDMQMPYLNGYQAAAKIKEKGIETPIVALTAYSMSTDRAKCIEAGCDDYISKPFIREDLADILKKYLPTTDLI